MMLFEDRVRKKCCCSRLRHVTELDQIIYPLEQPKKPILMTFAMLICPLHVITLLQSADIELAYENARGCQRLW